MQSKSSIDSGSTAPRLRRAALLRLLAVVGILGAGVVLPTAAAGEPGAIPFVQVRIDQVTPQVATTTSEPVVTVTGTVANIGDRPVRDVMIRLEHAPAVSNSAGLRTNLDGDTDQYQAAEEFVTVSPELRRGQKTKFTLSAPMRSAPSAASRAVSNCAASGRSRYGFRSSIADGGAGPSGRATRSGTRHLGLGIPRGRPRGLPHLPCAKRPRASRARGDKRSGPSR